MNENRARALAAAVLLALVGIWVAGCGDDDPAAPAATPPTLPDPALLTIDDGTFDSVPPPAARPNDGAPPGRVLDLDVLAKANFAAAYFRVIAIRLWTAAVLAPPVAAFAVAMHQTPQRQPDGSWLWVYTHVRGEEEWQIRLRGANLPDDLVAWEMRVTVPGGATPLDDEVWFSGTARDDGLAGAWTFFDPTLEGDPAVAGLEWGVDGATRGLSLASLYGENEGDVLTFTAAGAEHEIELWDESAATAWWIRWNEEDGSGSLMVPDYNGGLPACWDLNQDDVECVGIW